MGSSNKGSSPVAASIDLVLSQDIHVRSKVIIVKSTDTWENKSKQSEFTDQGEKDLITVSLSGQSHEVFIGERGEELTGHFYIFI